MKKAILPILLLHLTIAVNAATYYFSSLSGDDSRSASLATKAATPWKTIAKLNSIMSTLQPGDKILFKRGETFDGAIVITASGTAGLPITFGAFGTGSKPIINGFTTMTNWSLVRGNNIWETDFSSPVGNTNMVVVNNKQQAVGRYPNSNDANQGYLTINSHSGSSNISSSQLGAWPNWAGGEVVMRKMRWVTDRSVITNQSGNTLTFIPSSSYNPIDKYGFFIQSHTFTLDQDGEWYYDNSRKRFQICYNTGNPNNYTIKASVTPTLVSITYQNYISFNNLAFAGSNANTFFIKFCSNVTINNCDINFSGGNAIMANNTPYMNVTGTTVNNTNNNGIYLQDMCPNATVRSNLVKNTAIINGMGESDADTYQAVIVRGDNSIIEYNEIDTTGFNPLQFRGDYATVKNNYINYYDFLKDDGAGIYNGLGSNDNTVYHAGSIIGNIILNGIGATAGSDDPSPQSAGIYLDDNSNHLTISGNTVANCSMAGINNHNAHELTITGNTVFNNKTQLQEGHDYISYNPVRNCIVTNNILFSKTASQTVSIISSVNNDINQFGSFDGNYYCRPIDNNYVFFYSYYDNGVNYQKYDNLSGWQSKFGFDANSKGAAVTIPASIISSTSGVNMYMNGAYTKDISYVAGFSSTNDMITSWNPSKIDAGTLQVTANSYSYNNNLSLNLPINTITAGKSYQISFSLLGSTNDKYMDVHLRKAGWPYTELSAIKRISVTSSRTDYKFSLTATGTDDVSYIMFDYPQANGPIWLDNVQLQEAQVKVTNPDDYIVFQYNHTKAAKTYKLNGTYYDPAGVAYTSQVTLQPYTSIVLTKQAAGGTSQFQTSTDASSQAMNLQGSLVSSPASLNSSASSANLTWQVSNQRKNATSYTVERSSDAANFSSIGNTSVKTSADANVSYNFTDAAPKAGKNYYRIKQQNTEGVTSYSKVIAVNNISFRINPNPVLNVAHILFDQPVQATDHLGREVVIRNMSGTFKKTIQLAATENISQVDVNASSLQPGVYILSLTADGESFSKTFLKQ